MTMRARSDLNQKLNSCKGLVTRFFMQLVSREKRFAGCKSGCYTSNFRCNLSSQLADDHAKKRVIAILCLLEMEDVEQEKKKKLVCTALI